eukprot:TRINITY_DN2010_c0_g2_i6.p1 TRINITY_DN2010_c0_g2~~TRINITY_DN2010_c0_g2_i6.p1  ORF type:complete len:207 (+),score=19.54 TRINITY_DN2010_c0_g2_i6:104-724(+)
MSSLTQLNPEQAQEAISFISQTLGRPLSGDFGDLLRDGVILCEFINTLKPGSVRKINRGTAPFVQMENINSYLKAVADSGVENTYSFMTVDLFERKNLAIVALNIIAVKRHFGFGFDQVKTVNNNIFDAVAGETAAASLNLRENVTPQMVQQSFQTKAPVVSAGVTEVITTSLPMPTKTASVPKFCSSCGSPASGRFCSTCGFKLF